MTQSNLPVLLFLLPFTAALIVAALGWLVAGSARVVAVIALVLTAATSAWGTMRVLAEGSLQTQLGGWAPPIGIEVLLDPLSAFVSLVVGFVALIVVTGSLGQVRRELAGRETVYYACVLLLVSGLMGIVITGDLFNLFVQVEVASLSAYALVAAGGRGAPRAGLSYLILGSFGASLYLTGVGFLFAATGTLNMADLARLLGDADPRLVAVGGLLIVGGLGVKMALFPLHMWMPPAYARSPVVAAAVMAPLVTKVSAYALLRIMFWVFGADPGIGRDVLLHVIALAGGAAMLAGGVLALLQTDLRRVLAYSSIGQMGIIATGIGLGSSTSLTGAVLHIANDALMKGALFLVAGVALLRFGVSRIDELHRLRGRAPWTAAAVVIAGLSLVGIPPLSGFFGKWYVLSGALAAGRWDLAAALIISSLATIAYVFRIIEQLFFTKPSDEVTVREGPRGAVVAAVILAALIILVGIGNARIVSLLVLPALPGGAP